MINIDKQIEYWTTGADDDLLTAELLIREKRILHGLFFCHLVIVNEYFEKTKTLWQWLKEKL